MLDPLDYAKFFELAWLLDLEAFTYGKIGPQYNFIVMSCNWPQGELARPLGVTKRPLFIRHVVRKATAVT
jgi:hypothetical protein